MYAPRPESLEHVIEAIQGWPDEPNIMAPCYLPSEHVVSALVDMFIHESPLPEQTWRALGVQKSSAINWQAMILNFPIRSLGYFDSEVKDFIFRLHQDGSLFIDQLKQLIPYDETTHNLVVEFLCWTAPVLFYMGFTDAIPHSSQVGRRCALEANRQKGTPVDILQAALTGWTHDPKLARGTSWSNVATHPLVACAIIHEVFENERMQELLKAFLDTHQPGVTPETFITGLIQALSINNDSRYVLENVILHKPLFYHFEAEPGLAEQIPDITDIALSRFESPSQGKQPPKLPDHHVELLKKIEFETGLRGLHREGLQSILDNLPPSLTRNMSDPIPTTVDQLYDGVITGSIHDPDLIQNISNQLKTTPNVIEECRVCALHLFSHHQEAKDGAIAAWSLAVSDPLLLSPHKLLVEGNTENNNSISRLQSFINSFSDNIRWLPLEAQEHGQKWQRDVYLSALKSAREITGVDRVDQYYTQAADYQKRHGHVLPLGDTLKVLEKMLLDDNTWKSDDSIVNFADVTPGDPEFYRLYRTLEKYYVEALNTSPEMFGPQLSPVT